jgi:type VI secretion system protein ImpL
MFAVFKRRAFLRLIGFLLVAIFIWYAGPYFAFGTYRPLESEFARLIAIAVVVLLWVGSALLRKLRAFKASDRLVAAVLTQSAPEPKPSAEAVKLRERFEEAVATIQGQRRSGHSLYDLPWYVIIGAPGSGKTTALLNSGLKFPSDQRLGKVAGVGGTRNCDWWFTDEAIFLDTAGRYTTQDSDAASDSAGWSEFLALLLKYRKRRPVNGVILTISAQDLLTKDERGREGDVEAARRRLLELNRELHIQLPVYVMVTKCDLVAGFNEYFDDLTVEGRAQVWGVTFPYEQTLSGEAAQGYPTEFEALIERLNARVFARVEEDRDVQRRTKVFSFPQQMAALRETLVQFVSDVFASTRLDQPLQLRGVYFTSGTQDGTQIDRLLGAIGRRFGVAPGAVAPPPGRGKAYFVERLLKEVLIGESGLASVNRRLEMKKAAVQLGAYAALALVTVVGIIVLSVSYSRNRSYIAEAASDVDTFRKVPPVTPSAPLEALLPRLDAMRAVVDSTNRYRDDRPWAMRWGLYQGTSIGNAARDAYLRELDGILLPRFAARLRQRLGEYGREPEKLYVYLKAYLMLGEPKHLDKAHLQYLADLEWKGADGTGTPAGESASKHFQSLLEYGDTLRPIALDPALVAQARSTIRQASVPRIMYSRIQASYATDVAHAVRLDAAGGIGMEKVLKRKSGVSLSEPMPSLFSRTVFKDVTGRGTAELVKQYAEDSWVWGGDALAVANPVRLAVDVRELYERDYIAAWDGMLRDIELVPFTTVRQTAEALGILASPTSPLRGLLKTVADNTTFVEQASAAAVAGSLSSAAKTATDKIGTILKPLKDAAGIPTTPAGAGITAHFQSIHRLMAGAPGSAPIDAILGKIGQIEQQLKSLGPELGGGSALDALRSQSLRDLTRSLQDDAKTLPPVLQDVVSKIGSNTGETIAGDAGDLLERQYRQDVLAVCNQVVTGRYPFAEGTNEVPLADFGRLFGNGGVFDTFFKANVESLVDTEQAQWTWKPGAVTSSQSILDRFQAASRLRDTFFRAGTQVPSLRFNVTLTDLDGAATRFILQIDGQRFDVGHEAPHRTAVTWPASDPGEAISTFEDRAGAWPSQKFSGPWALFRLLETAMPQRESDLRVGLTFQHSGHQVRGIIEAATILNPFTSRDWQRFRCGS